MLGDVCDAPFVRLAPVEGRDPAIEAFLRDAWAAHLRAGDRRLCRRRYHVRLQVEAEVVEGEVHKVFVEVVRGSRESAFDAALCGALRATGCLSGLPLAWSRDTRAVLFDATFTVPDLPDRALPVGEAFAARSRDALARLMRSGLLPAGPTDLPLRVARAPRERWHVDAEALPERVRALVLGALAGAGLLAERGDERLGDLVDVPLRLVSREPSPRAGGDPSEAATPELPWLDDG